MPRSSTSPRNERCPDATEENAHAINRTESNRIDILDERLTIPSPVLTGNIDEVQVGHSLVNLRVLVSRYKPKKTSRSGSPPVG